MKHLDKAPLVLLAASVLKSLVVEPTLSLTLISVALAVSYSLSEKYKSLNKVKHLEEELASQSSRLETVIKQQSEKLDLLTKQQEELRTKVASAQMASGMRKLG